MGKINWSRVVLGGLLAGLIINVIDFLVNTFLLKERWADAMQALGKPGTMTSPQIIAFLVVGFLVGIMMIWLYAAIRPRYGAGVKTAFCAGTAVWVLGCLLPTITPMVLHLFPRRLMAIGVLVGLVEAVLGAVAGAWLYKE
ncbi:MAG: hypothetical protein ABSD27_11460 [Bryobacteraceae bacterium]|jgi:hypothetical protein